jgi:hypothetical protein
MSGQPEEKMMPDNSMSRRQLFLAGGVAAGAELLRRGVHLAPASAKHVMSFIGEYATHGAYISSFVQGDVAIDLAVSTFPDMRDYTLVGEQPAAADSIVRHDLNGGLMPGTQYYARLVAQGRMFGRQLSFRTGVADAEPADMLIALVSCQRLSGSAEPSQLGWQHLLNVAPDMLLHMGDYGYWGGQLGSGDLYTRHIDKYVKQTTRLPAMRALIESLSSLIQVSDHETSVNGGDNYHDPKTGHALEAYFRLMPFRSFDDPRRRSRFLTRKLTTNVRLISPDFRSLDRSPGAWPDDAAKTAYGEIQFELVRAALRAPEPVKIILSDPGCSPADAPASPGDPQTIDKWCNYQDAFQKMADVIRYEKTVDGGPILVDVWSGDRHMLGRLSQANNPWGPFDVLTSSGMEQVALELQPGELYDQVFGERTGPGQHVKQHMEIALTDDKVGTITRVARGIDDFTGTEVIHSMKTWSYSAGDHTGRVSRARA